MGMKQTFGMKTDAQRIYMTVAELLLFQDLNKRGSISFFRLGKCDECETVIHKSKQFCSKTCKDISEGTIEPETEDEED